MIIKAALDTAQQHLTAAGIDGARQDARKMLAHCLQKPSSWLMAHDDETLSDTDRLAFFRMVEERAKRRPVAQILGVRAFWGRDFRVTRDTLDPRPETEILVETALQGPLPRHILDLGTGTGAILVSLLAEWPAARGIGVDLSPKALDVARRNAADHGVEPRCRFHLSDWFQSVTGRFDLIVCNPPYISAAEMQGLARDVLDWEPHLALTPGGDGLDAYRHIAANLSTHLAPGGCALFEIGPSQSADVTVILADAGLQQLITHQDLDGRDRVISAQMP